MAASPNYSPAAPSGTPLQPAVITVGDGAEFLPVREWLEIAVPPAHRQHFSTLEQVLQTLQTDSQLPDLAIVFRSWCDEHPQSLVQQFIGRLFFRRILCCDGPLCTSEARTHQFWPISCRTSLAAAPSQIAAHLRQLQTGHPSLSPLAAPEDLFASQATATLTQRPVSLAPQLISIAVFVADAVLRKTIIDLLQICGFQGDIADPASLLRLTQNPSPGPQSLIVDADEQHGLETLLRQLKHNGLRLIALTGFPGAALPDWATHRLDKTELLLQLPALQPRESSRPR
ncbi:MAG: hypothetical protein ACKO2P_04495 [Planctomycetota bacterium]